MSSTYVALLRGVNVGGKNKLPMKELCAMFTAAGCSEVRNYIQSGNILFRANAAVAKKVASFVGKEIEQKFGFQGRMVLRTADQLRWVIEKNPYLDRGEELLSVLFLAGVPGTEAVASLDPERSPADSFLVMGDTVFLHTPTGLANTKLTNAYFDSRLKTFSTGRNWRTVLKLLEMMEG